MFNDYGGLSITIFALLRSTNVLSTYFKRHYVKLETILLEMKIVTKLWVRIVIR